MPETKHHLKLTESATLNSAENILQTPRYNPHPSRSSFYHRRTNFASPPPFNVQETPQPNTQDPIEGSRSTNPLPVPEHWSPPYPSERREYMQYAQRVPLTWGPSASSPRTAEAVRQYHLAFPSSAAAYADIPRYGEDIGFLPGDPVLSSSYKNPLVEGTRVLGTDLGTQRGDANSSHLMHPASIPPPDISQEAVESAPRGTQANYFESYLPNVRPPPISPRTLEAVQRYHEAFPPPVFPQADFWPGLGFTIDNLTPLTPPYGNTPSRQTQPGVEDWIAKQRSIVNMGESSPGYSNWANSPHSRLSVPGTPSPHAADPLRMGLKGIIDRDERGAGVSHPKTLDNQWEAVIGGDSYPNRD